MPAAIKRKTKETKAIEQLLKEKFRGSKVDVYQYNSASIRIRMIYRAFRGKSLVQREEAVFPLLEANLPEDTMQQITVLLLLTPEDEKKSLGNFEFEHPSPSMI